MFDFLGGESGQCIFRFVQLCFSRFGLVFRLTESVALSAKDGFWIPS